LISITRARQIVLVEKFDLPAEAIGLAAESRIVVSKD
jgi:hypothetical protein